MSFDVLGESVFIEALIFVLILIVGLLSFYNTSGANETIF